MAPEAETCQLTVANERFQQWLIEFGILVKLELLKRVTSYGFEGEIEFVTSDDEMRQFEFAQGFKVVVECISEDELTQMCHSLDTIERLIE